MKTAIFLDFDGVLNDHKRMRNGYCSLRKSCVRELAYILRALPDTDIIISSAWRYMIISSDLSTRGLEYILCLFGMPFDVIRDRITGRTDSDEFFCRAHDMLEPDAELDYQWLKEYGHDLRRAQIYEHHRIPGYDRFVVLDDIPLDMPELIQTDPNRGLTKELADRVISRLRN